MALRVLFTVGVQQWKHLKSPDPCFIGRFNNKKGVWLHIMLVNGMLGAKLDKEMCGKLKLRVELKLGRVKKTPDPCFIGRSGCKRELC